MSKEKEKIKYPGFLNKLWYDPIWSKVIYSAIIFLIGLIYSFFITIFKDISAKRAFLETINYSLKLYVIFIIVAAGLILYGIIYRIRQKRNRHIGNFDVEQRVGDFSFRELYNALLTNKTETPVEVLRTGFKESAIDLLSLFILYQRQLNRGMEWNHDFYTYYDLGPMLMTYGLVEKTPTTNKQDSIGSDMIQTSKVGYEFYALLERWRVHNDWLLKEELIKTKDKEHGREK